MRTIFLYTILLLWSFTGFSQTLSRKAVTSGGSIMIGGNIYLSQSIGQVAVNAFSNGWTLTQGFQQPEITLVVVNIKAFLEGLYASSGQMTAALLNAGIGSDSDVADSIRMELHSSVFPYAAVYSKNTLISTSGNCSIGLSPSYFAYSYYIVLKHRNSLEVWSKMPLVMNSETVVFDITTNAGTVYGDNLKALGGGVYAIYSGDVDQNGSVDLLDISELQMMLQSFASGYLPEDLNGDALTESVDYSLVENNIGRIVAKP